MDEENQKSVTPTGSENKSGNQNSKQTVTATEVILRNNEMKIMQEETKIVAQPVGNTNMNGEEMKNKTVIVEDSMADYLSKYFNDAAKGPIVVHHIDKHFHGNTGEAIATWCEKESTKPLAEAILDYEYYVEDIQKRRKEAQEANRPKKVRKDPVIRHDLKCEICGKTDPDCKDTNIGGAKMLACTGCQWHEDRTQNLSGMEKFNYLCSVADVDPKQIQRDGDFPVMTVQLWKGLPQHPTNPNLRIMVPSITNAEKLLLNNAERATVKVIGRFESTVKVQIVKVHQREAPKPRPVVPVAPKRTFFARIFCKDGNIHVESLTIKKRISIPRAKKDEIFAKKELWGMWKMEVIREKENEDFVFAVPVQQVEDREVPDRELPNVFFATVRIFDGSLEINNTNPDNKKRITIPREMIPRLRYKLGVWKFRAITEGPDYTFAKPIEHIDNRGISRLELADRLNKLQKDGKIEL